jgi:hypothetical protein
VRILIVRPSVGIMDGVSLSHLTPGMTYDLPAELAYWLMSRGVATQAPEDGGGLSVPLDNPFAYEQLTQGVSVVSSMEDAAGEAESERSDPRKKR